MLSMRHYVKVFNDRYLKGDTNMDLIPSFSVDHTKIVPGIFTSRVIFWAMRR